MGSVRLWVGLGWIGHLILVDEEIGHMDNTDTHLIIIQPLAAI